MQKWKERIELCVLRVVFWGLIWSKGRLWQDRGRFVSLSLPDKTEQIDDLLPN